MPMSWDEVRKLADAGWEIGSHTRTHPRLTTVDSGVLEAELRESRRECEEQVRVRCSSLAYPYGDVDARVVAAARSAGYEAACALPRGRFARPQHLLWPRVGVYGQDGPWRFRLKTSPVTRAARELPAWTAADRLRRAIGHRGRRSAPHPRD
jgi:peptidoglycan/xylan/chitin deacetylase (PgdA/CDA1 family)